MKKEGNLSSLERKGVRRMQQITMVVLSVEGPMIASLQEGVDIPVVESILA